MGPLFADAEADDFSQVPAVKRTLRRCAAAWTQPWTQTAREANLTASVVQAEVRSNSPCLISIQSGLFIAGCSSRPAHTKRDEVRMDRKTSSSAAVL